MTRHVLRSDPIPTDFTVEMPADAFAFTFVLRAVRTK